MQIIATKNLLILIIIQTIAISVIIILKQVSFGKITENIVWYCHSGSKKKKKAVKTIHSCFHD